MRIAILNDDALPQAKGGAAVIVEKLRRQYERRGHRVLLVTTHQDASRLRTERSPGVISLYSDYPLSQRHRHCLGDPEMRSLLTGVLAEWKPDAVHAHNVHTHLTYESLRVAQDYTERIILTAHDTLLVSYGRVRGPRYEKAALQGKPLCMHWWEHLSDAGRKYWPPRNAGIRTILKKSGAKVVGISQAVSQFLQVNGVPVAKTIPNGIEEWNPPSDDAIRMFKKRYGLRGPVILFVGRVREDKGIRALLAAMEYVLNDVPNAQLVVNGEEEHLRPHLAYATERVSKAVTATGWIPREQTILSYFAADVVTTPSLYLDNFPTVNLEAMAAGKPVVGTCFGGTPEVVQHGITGSTVNPRDTTELANALTVLLKDLEQAKKMGQAGRNRVREKFSLEKQADSYLELLR